MDQKPMTSVDFDLAVCEDPDCTQMGCAGQLVLQSSCHPLSATWIVYEGDGILRILCGECKDEICFVAVASGY